ncbi:hypothetical protein A5679_02825 [Mycobacterium scrofulaceum]|uniref:Uncharacterized protein n=1 Tax=Mycobacterium scrofulaceum TaxID=1783 RepID=A0A1A2UDD0_MYCSC|nr:hypothetical protein A5679_02825 [Mycobacterium scrofulaceum]
MFSPQAGFQGWFGHQYTWGVGPGCASATPSTSAEPADARPLANRAPAAMRVRVRLISTCMFLC